MTWYKEAKLAEGNPSGKINFTVFCWLSSLNWFAQSITKAGGSKEAI